jgi:hypothetical protein
MTQFLGLLVARSGGMVASVALAVRGETALNDKGDCTRNAVYAGRHPIAGRTIVRRGMAKLSK